METPQGEKITAAEFRIYKEPISNGHRVVSWENSTYEVKIYQVRNIAILFNRAYTPKIDFNLSKKTKVTQSSLIGSHNSWLLRKDSYTFTEFVWIYM